MSRYAQKISQYAFYSLFVLVVAFANWQWPIYLWFGDTVIARFVWLGVFFLTLDILIECILQLMYQMHLMGESIVFGRDIKKIDGNFHVVQGFLLPNKLVADYVVIGSSGVWLVTVKDDKGKVEFNGEYLVQDGLILKDLMTKVLERAYSLTGFLKLKLNQDIKVAPVVAFSSLKADIGAEFNNFRGIYVVGRSGIVKLIENTDVQLIDKNTIEEIYKILKNV